jgi:phosphohistidine swiveling domain-containing protein
MIILPLATDQASLASTGGKGVNLTRLKRAGYSVPNGFIVTTAAYQSFVSVNQLDAWIINTIEGSTLDETTSLEAVSRSIRSRFLKGRIPEQISSSVKKAYREMGKPAVAVRSSATAEDLPGFSFAGQQETFLNVVDETSLLRALVECWSSLWTGRAIGYRARNGIPQEEISLAVVVQEMVASEASGVMFTANPVTGLRSETVIEAVLGLGEVLVSGQVEPDRYVIEVNQGKILEKSLGTKAIQIMGAITGGLQTVREDSSQQQALPDAELLKLVKIGQAIEVDFGVPQDIEWAWAGGKIFILQARPITALYPLPSEMDAEHLRAWFSFGAVQGMLEPMTPLGRDAIRQIFAGGASLLGYRVNHESQGVLRIAGERLWGDITAVISNSVGRKVGPVLLKMVEPGVAGILDNLLEEPQFKPKNGNLKFSTARKLAGFALPMLGRVLRNWMVPQRRRLQFQQAADRRISLLKSQCGWDDDLSSALSQHVNCFCQLYDAFHTIVPTYVSAIIASMSLLNFLTRLAQRSQEGIKEQEATNLVLEITRGVPNNLTTEMDLALWRVSRLIDTDPTCRDRFQGSSATQLARDYLSGQLPRLAQEAIKGFLDSYGMRGVGEIDIGRSRWEEDPEYVFRVLDNYFRIQDESQSPEEVFKRSEMTAESAINQLVSIVRKTPWGWLKAPLVRLASGRVRALIGLRESPKFHIMRMMRIVRRALLVSGEELRQSDLIDRADDMFFLTLNELQDLAKESEQNRSNDPSQSWNLETFSGIRDLIAERRHAYEREKLRNKVPLVLLSDGRTYYEKVSTDTGVADHILIGSPVSPGVVKGRVRVVLDPLGAQLLPGEILVCPGTDPAWTPLFLTAGGLIMEVGGMMTHGSVIAREYGIPAVVGVPKATSRLQTGQLVQVDGSSGRILILTED